MTEQPPPVVAWTRKLEEASALDAVVGAIEPTIETVFGTGTRAAFLRGEWLGHALHPVLTDAVLGSWTSASVLDLVGGPESRTAARTLVGTGLLAVPLTAWTGWAEWSGSGTREKRVGLVHAATVGSSIGLYLSSWLARRRGNHSAGAALALGGAATGSAAAYLGGHLAVARNVGSHHRAFDEPCAQA
ncbi:MAG TPA: (2Fe-2S)-binding protein [Ornithinimicrobium sp.]|uniref:(2Fe-2S)-binding protein n=1 Tax=Ornithinimicrobium sp. TaxID=1977084 RepID=UPI002B48B397|nr:(2Fe-2S)-binding protein [Ornithinimicrobium sp.]HKJ10802.1 (2Fe-2S)-binding protein [Ornithinimicrobium sp.]